jgi:hypothetical protein
MGKGGTVEKEKIRGPRNFERNGNETEALERIERRLVIGIYFKRNPGSMSELVIRGAGKES